MTKEEIIILSANIDGLEQIKEYSLNVAENYICDIIKQYQYVLCVDEIFTNCIIHAYDWWGGKVELKVKLEGEFLITTIRDFGVGISQQDINSIPNKKNVDKRVTNSKGLSIVYNVSQKLDIKRCRDKGTQVVFHFRRDG